MLYRSALGILALTTVLMVTAGGAQAEDKKYPNWKGEWIAIVPRMEGQQLRFDPNKPYGRRQNAPLTEEYTKIYQESLDDQALGGQGLFLDHASCLPAGMPTMMSIGTFEYNIKPERPISRPAPSCVGFSPMDGHGPRTWNRRMRAFP